MEQADSVIGAVLAIIGVFVAVMGIAFLVFIIIASLADAHMHDRADLDDWFGQLHDKKGASCCSTTDGTTIKDADWDAFEDADGKPHYRVMMEGEWQVVPDDKVLDGPNKYGTTMVWYWRDNGKIKIRCFMPGSGT
jgi:hypothetical protein